MIPDVENPPKVDCEKLIWNLAGSSATEGKRSSVIVKLLVETESCDKHANLSRVRKEVISRIGEDYLTKVQQCSTDSSVDKYCETKIASIAASINDEAFKALTVTQKIRFIFEFRLDKWVPALSLLGMCFGGKVAITTAMDKFRKHSKK